MNQRLLSTPIFAVEQRTFARTDGGTVAKFVVVHPGAVVILPILEDGRIVMIRNFRYTVDRELWELPAGTRDGHEAPLETARRELEEETGYSALHIEPLIEFFASPGVMTERMHVFHATGLSFVGQRLEPNERITICPLPKLEVRRMLLAGELEDAKTIASLGYYFLRQQVAGQE